MAAGLWLGLMLLLDPNSILWLNRFLPEWSQVPMALTNPLQTMAEIQLGLADQSMSLGVEFPVGEEEVVIPVWQTLPDCEGEKCQAIMSLRLYFVETDITGQRQYSLLNEVLLSNMPLSVFTEIQVLPVGNQSNQWLSLEGVNDASEFASGDRYGVIFYYDAVQRQLTESLSWQSRAGRSPEWQDIIGDEVPELVIDQSYNLEPEFAVYRLENASLGSGISRLVSVNLEKAALDLPAYGRAIALAKIKLWALADQQLREVKQTLKASEWTAAAEEQRQLIAYHSKLTTQKCTETTLNVGQKIKHCLRAGDVNEALRLLQNNLADPLVIMAVVSFLETDGKDLQGRLNALHQLDPFKEAVTLWQFLALTAQGGQKGAIADLRKKQAIDGKLQEKINALLGRVEKTLSQQARPLNANSKVMGRLVREQGFRADDWLQPESEPMSLDPNQTWYRLEVSRYFDGQRWQQAPFNLQLSNFVPGQALWQMLGLDQDAQIYVGTPALDQAAAQNFGQVRGVQLQGGRLSLLVAAQPSVSGNGGTLGYTGKTLRWLTPDAMTVQELAKLEPTWVDEIVLNLWRHLRASDFRYELDPPPVAQLIQEFGAWEIQPIELTGNNHPEARLTVYLDANRKMQQPNPWDRNAATLTPHHLIFADTGELIYSELSQTGDLKLQAIADLQDGGVAALVLRDGGNNYSLKRWQDTDRTFGNL